METYEADAGTALDATCMKWSMWALGPQDLYPPISSAAWRLGSAAGGRSLTHGLPSLAMSCRPDSRNP